MSDSDVQYSSRTAASFRFTVHQKNNHERFTISAGW